VGQTFFNFSRQRNKVLRPNELASIMA